MAANLNTYIDSNGIVTVCAHCRRTQLTPSPEEWHLVAHFLKRGLFNVSHGLCPTCNSYFGGA